jgi:hypothetical protein
MRITPRAGSNIRDMRKEGNPMIKMRLMRMLVGLTLLAMVTAGCGTLTGAAVGAGSGAAIGAGTGNTKKGALIGTGVGAAAGAIYDATH